MSAVTQQKKENKMKKKDNNIAIGVLQVVLVFYVLIPAIAIAVYAAYCHLVNFLAPFLGTSRMPCM